ncbi:hypothetical protein SNEBB_009859 [Seison nebaliae]|nr:hypothetical protein SNEBB_009859 [Seison nebaliae]
MKFLFVIFSLFCLSNGSIINESSFTRNHANKLTFTTNERWIIFCKSPVRNRSSFFNLFFSNYVKIDSTSIKSIDNFKIYIASTQKEIEEKRASSHSLFYWFIKMPTSISGIFDRFYLNYGLKFSINSISSNCIGIESKAKLTYRIQLIQKNFDFTLLSQLILATTLFAISGYISSNRIFIYSSGISLGCLTSILLALYVFYRFLPKKNWMLFVFGIWSMVSSTSYVIFYLLYNLKSLIVSHPNISIGYFFVTVCCTAAYIYYMGFPDNKKFHHILQSFIQIICCLFIIQLFPNHQKLSVTYLLLLFTIFYFNRYIMKILYFSNKTVSWIRRHLPGSFRRSQSISPIKQPYRNPRKYIPPKEYEEILRVNTNNELEKLRNYLSTSAGETSWNYVTKINDPIKFAQFVTGETEHVSELEHVFHELASSSSESSSSEDEIDNEDNNDDHVIDVPPDNNFNRESSNDYEERIDLGNGDNNDCVRERKQRINVVSPSKRY